MNDIEKKLCPTCNGSGEGQVAGKWCNHCCGKGYELSGEMKTVQVEFMDGTILMPAPVELTEEEAVTIIQASLKSLVENFLPPEEIRNFKKFESN